PPSARSCPRCASSATSTSITSSTRRVSPALSATADSTRRSRRTDAPRSRLSVRVLLLLHGHVDRGRAGVAVHDQRGVRAVHRLDEGDADTTLLPRCELLAGALALLPEGVAGELDGSDGDVVFADVGHRHRLSGVHAALAGGLERQGARRDLD